MRLGFKIKARHLLIDIRIGPHLGPIEVQLLTPYQACRSTALDDFLEEALKDVQPVAVADFAQGTMIWHWFIQVVADIPALGQVHRHLRHELSLRADTLEKHD